MAGFDNTITDGVLFSESANKSRNGTSEDHSTQFESFTNKTAVDWSTQLNKKWETRVDEMISRGEIPAPIQAEEASNPPTVPLLTNGGNSAIYITDKHHTAIKEPIKIIHVPQTHYPPQFDSQSPHEELTSDQLDSIASSQHQIASYLKNNPDLVILSEGLGRPLTQDDLARCTELLAKAPIDSKEFRDWFLKSGDLANNDPETIRGVLDLRSTLMNFPQGVPENFENLSCSQKLCLAWQGGDKTLFYLGAVKSINPATTYELEDRIDKFADGIKNGDDFSAKSDDPHFFAAIWDVRERSVEALVQSLANDPARYQPGDRIAVIYGTGHEFSDNFKSEDGYRFEIAQGFEEKHNPSDNPLVKESALRALEHAAASLNANPSFELNTPGTFEGKSETVSENSGD